MSDFIALLLAAGRGIRFDPSGAMLKLIQPAQSGPHRGTPIAEAAARNLREAGLDVVAVVRSDDAPAQRALRDALVRAGCTVLPNPNADDGMGTSLACGVSHAPDAAGWVVALADMPAIAPATIAAVVSGLRDGHLTVAPAHRGQRGHPVGFGRALFAELVALSGDVGARDILNRHPPHLIAVDDAAVLLDIDTPASLQ